MLGAAFEDHMALYEVTSDALTPLKETSLAIERVRERQDLQRLLRDRIDVLGDDLLVICEEFGDWDASRRRIDLVEVMRECHTPMVGCSRISDDKNPSRSEACSILRRQS